MPLKVELISSGPDWWGLAPVLVGAVVGFLPSWILAKRSSNEVLYRDEKARKAGERALAFRMLVKINHIASSLLMLRRHVSSRLALRDLDQFSHMEPCQVVTPLANLAGETSVSFEADELSLIFGAGDKNLFEQMTLAGRRHAAVIASLQEYGRYRENMLANVPGPFEFTGTLGSSNLTQEQLVQIRRHSVPLNELILSIASQLDQNWQSMTAIAEKFGPAVRNCLEDPSFPLVTLVSD